MTGKVYLVVPYAEKDEAKALGARWDPALKKWYRRADQDAAAFSRWQAAPESTFSRPLPTSGPITEPGHIEFEPYSGVLPPWD